ncbi:putative Zn-dependent protease [Bradyrhizobium sp. GM7.3]
MLGSALAGCGDMGRFQTAAAPPTVAMPKPKPAVAQTPATEKEHERILASYGGTYDDPRLESLVTKTVDRLVAASDRPDQGYRVTILNSGAVNAFALPNGQLYVTRGLLALASDTSELSSVLSHEMAHVLSKHAAMREDQARQAAIVTRVVTDMSNDPDLTALALAKTKLTMASFSRNQEFEADGVGVGISAKAHFDPYGAARFLSAMERNAELKVGKTSLDPRAQDFTSSHPATPERVQNAQTIARQYAAPEGGERDRETYLAAIDNLVYGEDPSEGFVRGRRFLHPKLGFTFQAPDNFTLDNTAQAVIGVRDGGSQAMRFDVVRVPAEQSLGDYLNSRLDGGRREGLHRGHHHQRFSGCVRHRQGRPVAVQGLCAALRQRRLPLHLRGTAEVDRERAQCARDRRFIPPPDARRDPGRAPAAHQGHHRTAWRHRGIALPPHGRRRPPGRAFSRAQRARSQRAGEGARSCEGRGGLTRGGSANSAVVPASAGTHNPREQFGGRWSFGIKNTRVR